MHFIDKKGDRGCVNNPPHRSKAMQQRISVSSSDPLQLTLVGVGVQLSFVTMHMRVRVWIPSPHDALQAPYSVKFPNTASAKNIDQVCVICEKSTCTKSEY